MAQKYKPLDKVRIKSLDWYNENKDEDGIVELSASILNIFTPGMSQFCGKTLTIQSIGLDFYLMEEDNLGYEFTDEMIEGLVEEDIIDIDAFQDDNEVVDIIDEYVHRLKGNECQIDLPEGYQFKDENGNIINAMKIVLEKKKKRYPKTYEECCEVLDLCGDYFLTTYDAGCMVKKDVYGILQQVNSLTQLIICRDAYWKIAGEEMGLGKPWEPDCNSGYFIPAIIYRSGSIQKVEVQYRNAILSFPTAEMRDAFKENFKELIEQCKELL